MSRHNPISINTLKLCDYGCNKIGKFQFKSGKICCSDAIQKCLGHINRGLYTRRKMIDPVTGLNPMQKGQIASHIKKLKTGGYKKAGKAISKTKNELLGNGKRRCDISIEKMKITKRKIGIDGLTNSQKAARIRANKRLHDIDSSGLNQYERWTIQRIESGTFDHAFEKALLIKKDIDTGLRYQGSYEFNFIKNLKERYGIEWVKDNVRRGPSIQYKDYYNKNRWYLSDFIINNTIYEIKSNWTWNRRGKDKIMEQSNINKLKAAVNAGYNVKLIREGIEIEFA